MTQKYYTERLLPGLITTLYEHKSDPEHPEYKGKCILQEDNDGSHGTRLKNNVARQIKERAGIRCLKHPAQSPDLNPIEGIWNAFKQRLRQRYHEWKTLEELKEIAREEWDRIRNSVDGTLKVQRRIAEMPWRCEILRKTRGERIRSSLW